VEIDDERRIARVRSGAKWGNIVPVASEHGLAALRGSTPDVGITGYSLGGGLGWYARKLGLSTNSVTAIELVTADCAPRRVDHDNEPDLFWALHGRGGNFGIVTALEVQLYSIPDIHAGVLFFPWERSSEVLHAWREWTETVPEEMTSVGRILQFPPIEEIPEPLHSGTFVVVEGVYMGDEATGADMMRPIRDLGPVWTPSRWSSGSACPSCTWTRRTPSCTRALATCSASSAPTRSTASSTPPVRVPVRRSCRRRFATSAARSCGRSPATAPLPPSMPTTSPSASGFNGRGYLNFTEHRTDPVRFYAPHAYRRLCEVKRAYDPPHTRDRLKPVPAAFRVRT
jgi:hypothetical protein